jgi:hypothetical protein
LQPFQFADRILEEMAQDVHVDFIAEVIAADRFGEVGPGIVEEARSSTS